MKEPDMELQDLIKTTMDDAAGPLGLRDGLTADARVSAGRRSRRRTAYAAVGVTTAMAAATVALVALPRDGDGGTAQVLVPLATATTAPSPTAAPVATDGYAFAGVDFATLPDGFSRCAAAGSSADPYQVTVPRLPEGGTLAALRFGADDCAPGTPQMLLVVIHHEGAPVPVAIPHSNATAGQSVTDAHRTLGPYGLSAVGADVPQAALDEVLADATLS